MLQNRIFKALSRFSASKGLTYLTPQEKIDYLNKL